MALSMRRIGMLVTAVALMAAMLVATAMPAFADKGGVRGHCTQEGSLVVEETCAGGSGGPGGGDGGNTCR